MTRQESAGGYTNQVMRLSSNQIVPLYFTCYAFLRRQGVSDEQIGMMSKGELEIKIKEILFGDKDADGDLE